MQIVALITVICSMIVGLWKLFGRKAKEKRERIDAAHKMHEEGMAERDPRKIIGANDRLNNDV